jgi:DNA-binding transcriptional LysR family regulator
MDKLAALTAFRKVAELGSFSAAAEALDTSHPAVSKQVRALEASLKTTLINRTTRRLALTEAGRAYLERATRILDDLADADLALASRQAMPHGRLRVNAPMAFGTLHLADALPGFMRRYPGVEIDLVLNDRQVDLIDEGFDVGLRIVRELPDSTLVARHIAPMHLALCAAPSYLREHGAPAHPQELARHNCLLYSLADERAEWRFVDAAGKTASVVVRGSLAANTSVALRSAALAGLGLTLSSTFIVGADLATGQLLPLLPGWTSPPRQLYALYPHSRHMSPKVRAFVDYAVDLFATPAWDQTGPGRVT